MRPDSHNKQVSTLSLDRRPVRLVTQPWAFCPSRKLQAASVFLNSITATVGTLYVQSRHVFATVVTADIPADKQHAMSGCHIFVVGLNY